MKFLLLCLSALMLSLPTFAQNLSLNKLLKFREMEISKLNRKLERKDWTLVSDDKPTENLMGKAVWAYKPSGESAVAWCVLYYNNNSPSRILYNVYVGNAFRKIQSKIRRRKMSAIAEGDALEGVEQLEHYADYSGEKYVMRLITYKQFGFNGIKIFDKADYLKAKEKGRL